METFFYGLTRKAATLLGPLEAGAFAGMEIHLTGCCAAAAGGGPATGGDRVVSPPPCNRPAPTSSAGSPPCCFLF